jgi:hypothetical protein
MVGLEELYQHVLAEVDKLLQIMFNQLFLTLTNHRTNSCVDTMNNHRMELTTKYISTIFNLDSGGDYQYNKKNSKQKQSGANLSLTL